MPAVDFWENPDPFTEENFWRLLTSSRKVGPLRNPQDAPLDELNAGASEGVLLGGNLSLVCASLGTPFLPSLTGTILVLEDVDEVPYRLDRMLTQLLNSGVARKIKGLLLGQFTRCEPRDPAKPSFTSSQVLREFAAELPCPALGNLQYGHVPRKLTIPFGLRARIDAPRRTVTIPEAAVL
jgi:muramoyltetrapeptide carboxypeptidase